MPVNFQDISGNNNGNGVKNKNIVADNIINNTNVSRRDEKYNLDDGFSELVRKKPESEMGTEIKNGTNSDTILSIMHGANIFQPHEIRANLYTKSYRFGLSNPYSTLGSAREYLFFTKPDLHILPVDGTSLGLAPDESKLNPALASSPFWADLFYSRKDTTLKILQASRDKNVPFNYLLQNHCKSNLDIPSISSEMIDTPVNNYGVGYSYRGSSEASDDNPEFSLEFRDNRYLDTYYFFKAYEEYEILKHHGVIAPPKGYILNKVLHDCFSIYKFIVADDMETIVYWGKMYGVVPKSLPRDVFSNPNFDDGLSYSIDFKAAFYEDMIPEILSDFNFLGQSLWNSMPYNIGPFNETLGRMDTRPAEVARVVVDSTSATAKKSPTGYVYKLKWKGSSRK